MFIDMEKKFKVIIVEDVKLELKGTEEIFRHEIPNAEVIGTAMTEEFRNAPEHFHFYSVDEYIDLVVDYLQLLRPTIAVERFTAQSPKDLLVAPDWGLKNYEFVEKLKRRMRQLGVHQGDKFVTAPYI